MLWIATQQKTESKISNSSQRLPKERVCSAQGTSVNTFCTFHPLRSYQPWMWEARTQNNLPGLTQTLAMGTNLKIPSHFFLWTRTQLICFPTRWAHHWHQLLDVCQLCLFSTFSLWARWQADLSPSLIWEALQNEVKCDGEQHYLQWRLCEVFWTSAFRKQLKYFFTSAQKQKNKAFEVWGDFSRTKTVAGWSHTTKHTPGSSSCLSGKARPNKDGHMFSLRIVPILLPSCPPADPRTASGAVAKP